MKQQHLVIEVLLVAAILSACGQQTAQAASTLTTTLVSTSPSQTPTATAAQPTGTTIPMVSATDTPAATGVSFANDVLPIFKNNCNKCHGDEQTKKGLDMRTYQSLMAGSFNGPVITPGNANDSFLVHQIMNGQMPKLGQALNSDEIHIIINWVNEGALNN